jgi:hypothetical protein
MPKSNHEPKPAEAGKQVPARPHDSGSAANETVDGLDATAEALRRAAEDMPSRLLKNSMSPHFDS